MSIALMTLAWKSSLPAGRKMVLLALCDNANDQGECFPSVPMLAEKCSMGERTVQQHIADMEAAGIVTREMRTGRSTIYRIDPSRFGSAVEETHYVYRIEDVESGEFYLGVRTCRGAAETDGYMGSGAWFNERVSHGRALRKTVVSIFKTREEACSQERKAIQEALNNPLCRNQRVPAESAPREIRTPQISHPTPAESAPPPPQNLHHTPADFAPITINEPSIESSGNHKSADLPNWLPVDAWKRFCEYRKKASGKKWTAEAQEANLKKLAKFREQGQDLEAVIDESIANGWSGLFALKQQKAAAREGPQQLGKAGKATAAAAQQWMEESNA